ncbi:DUF4097 family beta strand repeat protein [candidate division KSB1 bacterium]|nr:DUF4097 family beta strand repeat protein [candidate division KSB1 bacterium]
MTVQSGKPRGIFWGVVIIIIGFLFLFDEQGWIDIGDLWPLAIIALGVWLIVRSRQQSVNGDWAKLGDKKKTFVSTKEYINESTTMGDIDVTIDSQDFKGGSLRTTFGDMKVDLSNLRINSGEQTLRLNTTFGDIKINAPKYVPYSIVAHNTAGDMKVFEDKKEGWQQSIAYQSENYETETNRLKIIAGQVFGDFKVW